MPKHMSHIPGHMTVGPNHKNTVGSSRDAGVAGNIERIPINPLSDTSGQRGTSTPIGAPGDK